MAASVFDAHPSSLGAGRLLSLLLHGSYQQRKKIGAVDAYCMRHITYNVQLLADECAVYSKRIGKSRRVLGCLLYGALLILGVFTF